MTRMIRLRIECPEIGWGDWRPVATRSPHVLALLYRWRGSAVLCVHNFDEHPHEVTLRLEDEESRRLADLIHEDHSEADARGRHRLSLDAHGYRWFSVGRPDPAPRRRTTD
jgi:maltose alpha-D-glucosyltransferase/alpha-amylase